MTKTCSPLPSSSPLQENPALMDSEDALDRRAQELVALGENEMRRLGQALKRRRQN